MLPFYSHFITSIGPWTLTRSREWFQQCLFPCPHALPIQAATTAGERDGPNASPALSTFYVVLTLHASHRQTVDAFSIPQFPWLAFSRPFVRASVHSIAPGTPQTSPPAPFFLSTPFDTAGSYGTLRPGVLRTNCGTVVFPPWLCVSWTLRTLPWPWDEQSSNDRVGGWGPWCPPSRPRTLFSFFILSMLFHFFGSWVHGLASSTAQRTLGPRLSISGTASIVALYPLIIARNVIACFMGSIVNAIISTPNYAKRRKRVSDVRPSTLLSRINVTGADTPNVPSVMSGFLFKNTSVIFNRRRGGKGHRGT